MRGVRERRSCGKPLGARLKPSKPPGCGSSEILPWARSHGVGLRFTDEGGGGMRLSDAKVGPAIAVSDMSRAKEFYESKLGLSGGEEEGDGGITYPCGEGTSVHVFPSPNASAS